MRKNTELELLCLSSPAHSCEKDGRMGGGPTHCISIHWKSVRVREREGGERHEEVEEEERGCLPTNVEEPNRCVKLIRDWLPLESIINTRASKLEALGAPWERAAPVTWLQVIQTFDVRTCEDTFSASVLQRASQRHGITVIHLQNSSVLSLTDQICFSLKGFLRDEAPL